MRPTLVRLAVGVALVASVVPATSVQAAHDDDQHSENLRLVKNLPYEAANGDIPNYGTDIEFATLELGPRKVERQFALAGSYRNGLQIVDITEPEKARIVKVYDCGVTQGDVQVFQRDDEPGRTFATYTSDTFGDGTSTCYEEAADLGFEVLNEDGEGKNGTFVLDITNPRRPFTVSFVEVPKGSHNQTVHPSGRYLYNSNSDLISSVAGEQPPAIEIFDISDFDEPKALDPLPLPVRPGLGTESHDITFNGDGTRAYSAALSQGVIIDTTEPAEPTIVSSFLDPAINVWHQSDPFTLTDPETGETRDFLIVEDEVAGAVGTAQCPNGGVHIYDITGENEASPVKVGYWNIDDVGPTATPEDSCTAHVFDIHEDEAIMTIAYYNGGVRVVDISELAGWSLGESQLDAGMKEIAFYRTANANTWSAKTPEIDKDGDFFLYGNDINRGLDVYEFSADGAPSADKGRWLSPAQALAAARAVPRPTLSADAPIYCLLPR